jgi:hypothetical protein
MECARTSTSCRQVSEGAALLVANGTMCRGESCVETRGQPLEAEMGMLVASMTAGGRFALWLSWLQACLLA